jgi:hypothetical protein
MADGRRWRKLRLHVTITVLLPTFIVLANWQLHRALGGNELSWAYTVEWPLFAIYAIVVWWRLLHEERGLVPHPSRWGRRRQARVHARDEVEDQERAVYNAYLASLQREEEARKRRTP